MPVPVIYFNLTHAYEALAPGWVCIKDLDIALWAPMVQKGRHTYMKSPDSRPGVIHYNRSLSNLSNMGVIMGTNRMKFFKSIIMRVGKGS